MYDHQKEVFVDYNSVEAYFGVAPRLIPDLKSLEGDTSDNLPGVKGVGSKTAATLLRRYGGVGGVLNTDNVKDILKQRKTSLVLPEGDFIGEMYRLVKIPELREAAACLSHKELASLEEQATRPLTLEPFTVHMLGEHVGVPFMDFKQSLPSFSVDLSNFIDLIKAYSLDNHPARSSSTISDLDTALSICSLCPLRGDCTDKGPIFPEGPLDADIMLVGPAPSQCDYDAGAVLAKDSPAHATVSSFLDSCGIDWRECWVTNVCKCHPPDDRPPTYGEMVMCIPYLRAEIDLIRPKLIITFGSEAMSAVTPYTTRVADRAGEILDKPSGMVGSVDAKVAISINPVAAIRSERCASDLAYSATVIKKLLDEVTK